ncbi:MAG TPA: GNAT family N-acetyltransferase [Nocardioides sp.]|nr:GNAT family N-acetyltransferase [Nocardioides sp.]
MTQTPERMTVLTTPRTALTTWLHDDLDDLHQLHSDPETMRWIRPGRPETLEESRARLSSYLDPGGEPTKWRVVDAATGVLLGRAGFGGDASHRELGYTLRPRSWGAGLGTELATALVAWHRAHPLPEPPGDLTAYAALANAASCRVLEKAGLGFVEEREHNRWPSGYYRL